MGMIRLTNLMITYRLGDVNQSGLPRHVRLGRTLTVDIMSNTTLTAATYSIDGGATVRRYLAKGARNVHEHFRQTTTLTPDQYTAGLTDFGPGRSKLLGNSAEEYLKVLRRGPSEAESHARLGRHLGMPALRLVRFPTTSFSRRPTATPGGGASGLTYTFTRQPNGTTGH
jgi:hypothetical protein